MNPTIQRYLPPALVFGTAVYFGWPPSARLDLGEDVVRTNSVRWQPADLAAPGLIQGVMDPFREVLVAGKEMEVEPETGKLVAATRPAGPQPELLQAGLRLDGIASIGGRNWAVLNGRPRLAGDVVHTDDTNRYQCQIVSVDSGHIVVRCEETVTELRPRPFGSARSSSVTKTPAVSSEASQATPGDVPPPPPQV